MRCCRRAAWPARRRVDQPGRLCPRCWTGIDFITPPNCALCGFPFDVDEGPDALCGACTATPPDFDHARAAVRYAGVGREVVLGLKHGDQTHAALSLAQLMMRVGGTLLADCDAVVPVPLHRFRLFTRRYNQSALIGAALARLAGVGFVPDLLKRTRPTPSQAGRTRRQRFGNVRGAFAVRAKRRTLADGRHLVLVDDVMTTGATVQACAKALKRAGAARVDVLSFARVVPEAGKFYSGDVAWDGAAREAEEDR